MCIAIYKPAGKRLTERVLRNSYSSNRDGAGFAYIEPAGVAPHNLEEPEICMEKGYFDFNKFLEAYEPHADKECLIHFRVATHKNVDGKNCHPWRVNDDLVFIHNGTINFLPSGDDNFSDTGNFNHLIMQPLMEKYAAFYNTDAFKWLVENSISSNNKLVFLDRHGKHVIIHEDQGRWDQGCWFSNTSYKSWNDSTFKVIEGQPDEPVTTYSTPAKTTTAIKSNCETKDGCQTQDIDPDDAMSASELESKLTGDGKEITFFHNIEDLDAALDVANNPQAASH